MTAVDFPESNTKFGPPPDMDESQVRTIHAYVDSIKRGNLDGAQMVVVAWQPNPDELADLAAGKPVFITMLGGLAPHLLTTKFEAAISPT
jgi:hypothetical protein